MTAEPLMRTAGRLKKWLFDRLRSVPLLRRFVRRWIKKRNVRIAAGVGAGLRFNTAGLNPAYTSGRNELPVQQAIAAHLKRGDVFMDIGANLGFFSTIAAHLVGPEGKVYAFEPVPENIAALQHNLSLNNFRHASVLPYAVSNRTGKGELLLSEWNGGAALATATPPPDLKGSISINLVSIDELIAQKKIAPPALVKIDVEGAEMEVLEGMAGTIQACRPVIIFEVDAGNLADFEKKHAACETFLMGFGYQVSRLEDSYQDPVWIVGHYLAAPGPA